MTATQSLYQLLDENADRLNEHLFHPNFSGEDRSFLSKKKRILSGSSPCVDEALWTFLVACGYAMGGLDGVGKMSTILTGTDLATPSDAKIWLEAQPHSPRYQSGSKRREGNTHVDLAIGSIAPREDESDSGIELANHSDSWVCFCEMKWYSDISPRVTHDLHRNQLIRVIENTICFQSSGRYVNDAYVTIVTPAVFKNRSSGSRLYWYKFKEYESSDENILRDIKSCCMDKTNNEHWHYPSDISERLKVLKFRWVTFDDLFDNIPDSSISQGIKSFWKERSEYA